MVTITVNGKTYGVEFRHRTQKLSPYQKRPAGLIERAPVKGISTCVIIHEGLVGVGTSLCVLQDNFCRRDGMRRAFVRAAEDCKVWDTQGLLASLDALWPEIPAPASKKHEPLPPERVEQLRNAGETKRAARAAARR